MDSFAQVIIQKIRKINIQEEPNRIKSVYLLPILQTCVYEYG
jgi:hypothetical protein